ncbi:hypothetical protein [Rhodococcoides kroppenstedtii]|uniref:hypothetical protein n=1 Tax=Rhodococcoides kroppenstedtii TaxID=293050 RepID=UPI0036263DEB
MAATALLALALIASLAMRTTAPLTLASTGHDTPSVVQTADTFDELPAASASLGDVELVSVTKVRQGLVGVTAKKTAAFAGCIFGVGVPIGLAWAIATNAAVQAWILGGASKPLAASVGGSVAKYLDRVKAMCGYALR